MIQQTVYTGANNQEGFRITTIDQSGKKKLQGLKTVLHKTLH